MNLGFFSTWTSADWVSISLSIFLFIAGAWVTRILGAKQEQVVKEVRDLQEATAELQIREKIGVIFGKVNAIEEANRQRTASPDLDRFAANIWQDGLSVLPLFKFASQKLQNEYRDALSHALLVLRENPRYKDYLERMFREIGEHVARLEHEKLACASILKGAISLTERELKIEHKGETNSHRTRIPGKRKGSQV